MGTRSLPSTLVSRAFLRQRTDKGTGVTLAGICAGGTGQPVSLPRRGCSSGASSGARVMLLGFANGVEGTHRDRSLHAAHPPCPRRGLHATCPCPPPRVPAPGPGPPVRDRLRRGRHRGPGAGTRVLLRRHDPARRGVRRLAYADGLRDVQQGPRRGHGGPGRAGGDVRCRRRHGGHGLPRRGPRGHVALDSDPQSRTRRAAHRRPRPRAAFRGRRRRGGADRVFLRHDRRERRRRPPDGRSVATHLASAARRASGARSHLARRRPRVDHGRVYDRRGEHEPGGGLSDRPGAVRRAGRSHGACPGGSYGHPTARRPRVVGRGLVPDRAGAECDDGDRGDLRSCDEPVHGDGQHDDPTRGPRRSLVAGRARPGSPAAAGSSATSWRIWPRRRFSIRRRDRSRP